MFVSSVYARIVDRLPINLDVEDFSEQDGSKYLYSNLLSKTGFSPKQVWEV